MDQEFRQDYGTTPNALLAARYGVATGTILKWARQLRLRKDPEYRRTVQSNNASKRRLTLEQRQHLAQLARGRKVSAETIAKGPRDEEPPWHDPSWRATPQVERRASVGAIS